VATVVQQLLVLYIFIFLGWFFGKRNPALTKQGGLLSFLLVNLFLPAKVFRTFSRYCTPEYLQQHGGMLLASCCFLLSFIVGSKLLAKRLTPKHHEQNVYHYSMTISNYAYMGYSLAEVLFGEMGLMNLIFFCIPFALYTNTFGFAALTGQGTSLKRLVNTMSVAIVAGVAFGLSGVVLPGVFNDVLASASACAGPLSMVFGGLTLAVFPLKEMFNHKVSYLIAAIRLLWIPALVWGVCTLLRLPHILPSAVLMACMPCGLNAVAFCSLGGQDCKGAVRLAMLTHLGSLLTLPFWLSILP